MILNVRTNIITGFLGVGKTTTIIKLLENRKSGERWSVLVNEFGEMGIDGHLMPGRGDEVNIKQVPGGCICCAAGLPLQVAVNQLLKQTNPDRLIIEPSGMGHPRNILKSLTNDNYEGVLDMRACLCLLDPKKLADARYLQSELFVDQIDVADRVVANKTDLCDEEDRQRFEEYILHRSVDKLTGWISQGNIDRQWLDDDHQKPNKSAHTLLDQKLESSFNKITLDFSIQVIFNYEQLVKYLHALTAQRIKGILHTDKGFMVINSTEGVFNTYPGDSHLINRLEIISTNKYKTETIKHALEALT